MAGTVNEAQFFSNKVVDDNGCWIWQGELHKGYGRITWWGNPMGAYRLALILSSGEIPSGLEACHTCNVKACINPDHLYWGTHAENMADKRGMKYVKSTPHREFCKRGHEYSKYPRRKGGQCYPCEKLGYIARKMHEGAKISRVNQKVLEFLEINLSEWDYQEYI